MDAETPQPSAPPGDSPSPQLGYFGEKGGPLAPRPEVEPNCAQALLIAIASLLFPPAAIVALIKAGFGLAEARRSQGPGRAYAVWAIALSLVLPCVFGLVAWRVWITGSRADAFVSMSNLRVLGQLVSMYECALPASVGDDIDAVVRYNGVTRKAVFTAAPQSGDAVPAAGGAVGTTYMLLPRTRRLQQIPDAALVVMAVDVSVHFRRDGSAHMCVLFCDGHAEVMPPDDAIKLIAASIPVLQGVSPATMPSVKPNAEQCIWR